MRPYVQIGFMPKALSIRPKPYPHEWRPGLPYVDRIETANIVDPQTELTAFRTGTICCLDRGIADFQSIKQTNPDVEYTRSLVTSPTMIGMNAKNPIFKDIRVRKAITLATDHDAVLKIAAEGDGQWRGPVSGQHEGWVLSQEELRKLMPYDPKTAKQLMVDAGYGQGITMEMIYDPSSSNTKFVAELFVEELKAAGINVKLAPFPNAILRAKEISGDYQALDLGADGQSTVLAHFTQNYRTGGSKNRMQLNDTSLDARIDELVAIADEVERKKKVLDLQRWLLENYYYKVTYYDSYTYAMRHPWVHGAKTQFTHFYVSRFVDVAEIWADK